jgi:hypothetical protein
MIFCVCPGGTLKQQLIGSWILAAETLVLSDGKRINSWGDSPFGFLTFDAGGHFSQMLVRSDLPKFAVRTGGTLEQNDAVAKGTIAYYGCKEASTDANDAIGAPAAPASNLALAPLK